MNEYFVKYATRLERRRGRLLKQPTDDDSTGVRDVGQFDFGQLRA